MNQSVYSITLDIAQRSSQVYLPVVLGDTARSLLMTPVSGGVPYVLADGCLAVFTAKKADGKTLFNHCVIEDGVRVRYDFTEQTANVEGIVECQLLLYGAHGGLLASPRFCLVVDARVVYDEVPVSESEKNAVDAMMNAEAARQLAESERADAEGERLAAEALRVLNETQRLQSETARVAAETERIDAENVRLTAEQSRAQAENRRASAEQVRIASEEGRSASESAREASETERRSAELIRTVSENDRLSAEAVRVNAENSRASAEALRESAEKVRVSDETARSAAERERQSAEAQRASAEQERILAEAERADAETIRSQRYAGFDSRIAENTVRTDANHKRITNLEHQIDPELFPSDTEVAYRKTVPENAMPYAAITEIGGMSRVCTNLIPFPYYYDSRNSNGITWTVNNDGSITVDGTSTALSQFYLCTECPLRAGETYTISDAVIYYKKENDDTSYYINNTAKESTFTWEASYQLVRIYCQVSKGATVSNVKFYPMLNLGEAALPYEPYFTGLRDAKVSTVESVGKCLFPASALYESWTTKVTKDGRACYRFVTNRDHIFVPIKFKENTRYTVRFDALISRIEAGSVNDWPCIIKYTDGTYSAMGIGVFDSWRTITKTSDAGKTVAGIGVTVHEYRVNNYVDIDSFRIVEGTEIPDGTKPYFKNTFPIPEEVQALDGYGQGINAECYNKIVLDPASGVKKYVQNVSKVNLGTKAYTKLGSNRVYYAMSAIGMKKGTTVGLSNIAFTSDYATMNNYDGEIIGAMSEGTLYVKNPAFAGMTDAEIKEYLNGVWLVFEKSTPNETDLSTYFSDDNFIGVEGDGTLTAVNEYGCDVPFTVDYMLKTENECPVIDEQYLVAAQEAATRSQASAIRSDEAAKAAEGSAAKAQTVLDDIAAELAKRGQLKPEFAESIEECKDTTKLYVLPDGYLYAYMLTTTEPQPLFTNLLPLAVDTDGTPYNGGLGYKEGYRLNSSGVETESDENCITGYIPSTVPSATLRFKNLPQSAQGEYVMYYREDFGKGNAITYESAMYESPDENGVYTVTLSSADYQRYIRITAGRMSADTVITINEEIAYGEAVEEYRWVNTGHAFVPADYEERILALESETAQNTEEIRKLKAGIADIDDPISHIRNWDAPVYDRAPVWEAEREKAAITAAEQTVDAVYAKYDALMAENPDFITRTDLGVCSDGITHVYRYDFCERESRRQDSFEWSETKPKIIVVTGIHREWNGIYSTYHALEEITSNPALSVLRRNVRFIVVPVLNPYGISGDYGVVGHSLNANGVEIHRNFEVGFAVSGEGTIHYTGESPLSEVESRYLDSILRENADAAYFLTCHSFDRDKTWGVGFLWGSAATKYMCNVVFRVIDKMGKAWHQKYGTTWEEGVKAQNALVLADPAAYPNAKALEDGDYRIGHAALTNTGGCEQRQATKYGIQATNFEVGETFFVLDGASLSAKAITHGTEAYVNFFLTAMGIYDRKDKKDYACGSA